MLSEDLAREGLNWYTYCGNNPVRFFDPSGLAQVDFIDYIRAQGGKVENIDPNSKGQARVAVTVDGKTSNWILNGGKIDDTDLNKRFGFNSFLTESERKAEVGISIISNTLYKDFTSIVFAKLRSNARAATSRIEGRFSVTAFDVNFSYLTPDDYKWFIGMVGAGSPGDFKEASVWVAQFPGIPFPGVAGKDIWYDFVVDGVLMNAPDLGNLNFGYLGSALGILPPTQIIGAGLAHIKDHFLENGIPLNTIPNFGDSPRCRTFTNMGRDWYWQWRI